METAGEQVSRYVQDLLQSGSHLSLTTGAAYSVPGIMILPRVSVHSYEHYSFYPNLYFCQGKNDLLIRVAALASM
jgi:hypothetical protein